MLERPFCGVACLAASAVFGFGAFELAKAVAEGHPATLQQDMSLLVFDLILFFFTLALGIRCIHYRSDEAVVSLWLVVASVAMLVLGVLVAVVASTEPAMRRVLVGCHFAGLGVGGLWFARRRRKSRRTSNLTGASS